MWYGFYGAVASDTAVFERKVEELCRELGERGDDGAADAGGGDAAVAELSALPVKSLRARAKVVGATVEQLEDAADSDDPKAALVSLVAKLEAGGGEGGSGPAVLGSAMAAGGNAAADVLEDQRHTTAARGSVGGEPVARAEAEPPERFPPPDAAGPTGAAPPSGKLAAFLADAQLERHAALLAAEGYAGVADLADAEDEDLSALGLKKPEVKRLRKALDHWMCD
jgi:hypothetical protein